MALGLSVIFGVVRVVNFAHGEMMTIAMYAASSLFAALKLDPFLAVLPVAAAFFVFGYVLQAGAHQPFITRPEHSQFMLLVAVAIIMVNLLLMIFGPDARNVQVDYQLESFELGADPRRQGAPVRRAVAAWSRPPAAVRVLPAHPDRQSDPRLRRQLSRRAGRRPEREAALRPDLRPRRRLRRGGRLRDGAAGRRHAAARARLHPARVRHRDRRRARARWPARCSAAC